MTEDRTLIISLDRVRSVQVGKWALCDTQVAFLIAEELNVEEKQSNQIQGISLERWMTRSLKNICD